MKNIFKQLQFGLLISTVVFTSSCKREKLDEVMSKENYKSVAVSLDNKTEIGEGSKYTLTGGGLSVPVTLQFSAPTTRAFTVNLSATSDNIAQLITDGVLPAGTVPVANGEFNVPTVVEVPIGVTSFDFDLQMSRSFIEINYGRNVAVSVNISNPTKDNTIVQGKDDIAVLVKTQEIMEAESVHNITFGTATNQFLIPTAGAYDIGSESVTVRVPITVQGELGSGFTVDAVVSPDSVAKYIQNGVLKNVVNYDASKISISNASVRFEANSRTTYLTFTTKINTLLAIQPAPGAATINKPVIGFALKNPSKYQVGKTKNTVFVILDPNFFRPYLGNYFLIKGAINAVSDPIYAANYDFGGEGIAFHDDNGKDGDGNFRLPDKVDVPGEYNPRTVVGWTNDNEWLSYTVNVEETGTYELNMMLGSPSSDARYTVFMDNVAITGQLSITNSGAYNNFRPHLSTVNLTKGVHVMKVYWNRAINDYLGATFTRKN
nr:carbohydrate-binding protein [Pedobacter panaciterrae]